MTDAPNPLRDPAFVEAFLDLVIPPSADGRLPGAGSLGIGDSLADAIQADARLGPVVADGLRAIEQASLACEPAGFSGLPATARREVVEAALGARPGLMASVLRYVYLAYYQHPRVLEGLGEPPRPPFPEGFAVEETDAGLLEKLRARRRS